MLEVIKISGSLNATAVLLVELSNGSPFHDKSVFANILFIIVIIFFSLFSISDNNGFQFFLYVICLLKSPVKMRNQGMKVEVFFTKTC